MSRRCLWAVAGAALLAGCAGRGKPAVEPRGEQSGIEPEPSAARPSAKPAPAAPSSGLPWRATPDQGYDLAPIPMHITEPRYPDAARERGLHGTVLVEFVIDASGRVARARVLESIPGLDAAALECVGNWRFKPALRAGKPVEATARAPLRF